VAYGAGGQVGGRQTEGHAPPAAHTAMSAHDACRLHEVRLARRYKLRKVWGKGGVKGGWYV
jgi:hypothetical protein